MLRQLLTGAWSIWVGKLEGDGCGRGIYSAASDLLNPQPPPSFAVSCTVESYWQITDEQKINRKNERSEEVEAGADSEPVLRQNRIVNDSVDFLAPDLTLRA